VLRATLDAALEEGLDGLSIPKIARRAGVHETTIYRRWGNKVNLAIYAVLNRTQLEIPAPDTGTLRGDLLVLLEETAAFVRTPLGRLLLQMAARQDLLEFEDARDQFWARQVATAQTVLERAEARGELEPGFDARLIYETLVGPLNVRGFLTQEPVDDKFLEDVANLLLTGILKKRQTRKRLQPESPSTSGRNRRL
jgi:AcrR family transcriptional regulator